MNESADVSRSGTRASDTAVLCDANAFNLRFLRAAMQKLGFAEIVETRTVHELVFQATARQAQLVVFDPAMQGGKGSDAIEPLLRDVQGILLVAFCSDDEGRRAAKAMDVVTVTKASIMQLDALIAAVEERLGRRVADQPEAIPVADMETPVWDLVPSLVNPEED